MPQPNYLAGADVAAFGATGAPVGQASALIDSYLKRPEGLIWAPDWSGQPCYMAKLQRPPATPPLARSAPDKTLRYQSTLTAYRRIWSAASWWWMSMHRASLLAENGTPLLAENGQPLLSDQNNVVEACVILGVASSPPQALLSEAGAPLLSESGMPLMSEAVNTITLASVQNDHASGCVLDLGRVLTEERQLPERRSVTRVSSLPLVRLLAGQGRYSYGRRSQQLLGFEQEFNLLADLGTLGGPPVWLSFDPLQAGVSDNGDIWIPAGIYAAEFTEVRMHYVSGWTYATLPSDIMQATANVAVAMMNAADLPANARKYQAGNTAIERFAATVLDTDTRAMLEPYRAKLFF